jgi:hypothetical protein
MMQYSERERPSPHKLSLCMLLQIWVMPRRSDQSEIETQINSMSASLSARAIRDLVEFLLEEISALDRKATERTMADLAAQLQLRVSGQDIVDCLRRKINNILSPDDLIDLFTSLKGLLSAPSPSEGEAMTVQSAARPTHLDGNSVVGIYIRRMLLVYNQMMFGAVSSLFEDMVSYQEEFRQSQEVPVLTLAEEFRRKQRFLSSRQLQLYLEQKASEIEKGLSIRPFAEMEAEIDAMLEVAPDLPRAYFLRYLVCLHHREFQGALEALHRYFDFCLRRGGPSSAGVQHGTIQYASLSLAALYLSFGFPEESLIALQETVRVAQQQNDHVCVAYSLSWLHQAMSAVNHPLAYQHLTRCLARARELNLPYLHTLTSLAVTQHNLLRPRKQPTPTVHLSAREETAHPLKMWQALHTSVVDWRACSSVGDGGAVGAIGASSTGATVVGAASAPGAPGTAGATGAAATAAAAAADAASKQGLPRDMHRLDLDGLLRLAGEQQLLRSSSWALFGHQVQYIIHYTLSSVLILLGSLRTPETGHTRITARPPLLWRADSGPWCSAGDEQDRRGGAVSGGHAQWEHEREHEREYATLAIAAALPLTPTAVRVCHRAAVSPRRPDCPRKIQRGPARAVCSAAVLSEAAARSGGEQTAVGGGGRAREDAVLAVVRTGRADTWAGGGEYD